MNELTKEIAIKKLGTLMWANTELAAENVVLSKQVKIQADEIERMKAELRGPELPLELEPAHANGSAAR